jgi:hypothetical protein
MADYSYQKKDSNQITEELLEHLGSHPQYNDFVRMVDEAVTKDYEGGIVFKNCFPEDWNSIQVGFMLYSIERSYEQVASVEFYPENGMYIFLKNKKI